MPFTQAQGGGRKGARTSDHLFILRTIIDVTIKQKRPTYLTFYDVSKAYDHVDNEDLLNIMWENGLRGKSWRILYNLNNNLIAQIKTKYGTTRVVDMAVGGKQGSRLTGRMFSKMMDLLEDEIRPANTEFKINDLSIATLLWVDDVVSCTEGSNNQHKVLQIINEFAVKHKLQWGSEKCQVMKVGKHPDETDEWTLGNMTIHKTDAYKYLGDIVTADGKNEKNIENRKNKITAATIGINTIASSDVLRQIETAVILELHEKVNIPALLTNAEAWTLSKGEKTEIERAEIQSLKYLFDLPAHTPTPGIIFSFGVPYTIHRIDQKRFLYLHHILSQDDNTWTKMALNQLNNLNLGWAKSVNEALVDYNLHTEYATIRQMTTRQWTRIVKEKVDIKNKRRLLEDCHRKENGETIIKTKTAHLVQRMNDNSYEWKPDKELTQCSKQETKALIIARFHMLECGQNYKGTLKEVCVTCNCPDDENHRLNECVRFRDINFYDAETKINFQDVFSTDLNVLKAVIPKIQQVWNVTNAHGTMNK